VHAHHEHLLVMRPVEDADLSPGGKPAGMPSEVIVCVLLGGGQLEAAHVHALGFTPLMTWRMVLSFPEPSIPCRHSNTGAYPVPPAASDTRRGAAHSPTEVLFGLALR
jgi:hypothetical protein